MTERLIEFRPRAAKEGDRFWLLDESRQPSGLFAARVAQLVVALVKEKYPHKKTLVDVYQAGLSLALANEAKKQGLGFVLFYDQFFRRAEIDLISMLDCSVQECTSRKEALKMAS